MNWTELKHENDIDRLTDLFGSFHDGCLREVHIVTRESVAEDLSMAFDNQLTATLLFQRQYRNPTVIEIKFDNVRQFNFNPPGANYNSIIYDATLKKVDDLIYWASEEDWQLGDNDAVWISGESAFWRERPDLIGPVNRLNEN